ncbi:MAG: TolC family protein, partial [Acidobacteriota bacterium]
SFSVPLRQRTADGRIAQARLKLEKLALDVANERQRITTEVLDAISAINTATTRYLAALAEVNLARQLEEGERARFDLGDSTLFLVNQRERATAEARVKLIEIQAEYEQSVAAYRAATVQF